MVDDPTHLEGVGRIPPQGGPQNDGEETSVREGRSVDIPPAGGHDGEGRTAGGGDLRLPPPEHSHKVSCDQANYVPVSGGVVETRSTGLQAVVEEGQGGCVGYADGGSGGGTDGVGGGDVRDGNRYIRLIWWEYTVSNVTLGTETNAALTYATGLELHHPIMSMIGGHRGRLDR